MLLIYAAILSVTTINLDRMTGDQGNHAVAGILVRDIALRWAADPLQPFSQLKAFAIDHHMHYKSFASFITYGPLHFFFMGFVYLLLGISRFTTILPTIIESMLLMFFVWKLADQAYGDRRAAFLAAFLVAFNPVVFFYSSAVMLDVGATMFIVASFYCLARYLKKGDGRFLYLGSITAALAFLTRPPMMLIVPVILLAFAWERRLGLAPLKKNGRHLAFAALLFLLFVSPYFIEMAMLQSENISLIAKWLMHAQGWKKETVQGFPVMDGTDRYVLSMQPHQNLVFYISTIFFQWYLIPFYIFAVILMLKKAGRFNATEKFCILMIVIFLAVFSTVAGAVPRFMVYTIPFFVVPLSRAISILAKSDRRIYALVAIIAVLAVAQCSGFLIKTRSVEPIGDFDSASAFVISDSPDCATVITTDPRPQTYSIALLDRERKIYVLHSPWTAADLDMMVRGTFSDPEWKSLGISYPPVRYIMLHETNDNNFTAYVSRRPDFELAKTIDGPVPGARIFIFRRK